MQTFFIVIVILLAWLVFDVWRRPAIWVKGARNGLFSFRDWAHQRERDEDPFSYWFAMGFYGLALLCLGGMLLFG